jgi:hypothetical protein
VVHPIHASHGSRVIEAYFAGGPPFKEPKRRDDFPDAFLWQAVHDLAEAHRPLYVVSADKTLLNAARGIEGVVAHDSLEEFITSEPFQIVLRTHFASTNLRALLTLLPEHLDRVSSVFSDELINSLVGETVRSADIPDDSSEAIISSVADPTDVTLDVSGAVDHGNGLFVVPFSLQTDCLVDYAIFKADFYALPEQKSNRISTSELNRHYYSAEEEYTVLVDGRLSVEVNAEALKASDVSEEDLLSILEDAKIAVDAIERLRVVPELNEE